MRVAIIALTKNGKETGKKIKHVLKEHEVVLYVSKKFADSSAKVATRPLGKFVRKIFHVYNALVFVMALGIVVRVVSGIRMKKGSDPAVVAVDEKGKHVISVLSGHYGANELAALIASRTGAEPVITTATEEQVQGGKNIPKNLVIGIGARKGVSKAEVLGAVRRALSKAGLSAESIRTLATADFRASEGGVVKAAAELSVPLRGVAIEKIKEVEHRFEQSDFVREKVGVGAVCEPAAFVGGGNATIVQKKMKFKGVTVAIARASTKDLRSSDRNTACMSASLRNPADAIAEHSFRRNDGMSDSRALALSERMLVPGKIYIVGIGPGRREHMTPKAQGAMEAAEVVIGYKTYLREIKDLTHGKKIIESGMGEEVERARLAADIAESGKNVAVVSSGDPGIYAMASVVFEQLYRRKLKIEVEVIPGITAASAAAALLGSPLGNDFAVVSLSDLLTPWEVIERRLEHAAKGDFVIVIYNPKSRGREQQIEKAVGILLKYRKPSTPVGVVRNAMKDEQSVTITTLEEMLRCSIDMASTIIVGSSETFVYGDKVVTPRGYARKYYDVA